MTSEQPRGTGLQKGKDKMSVGIFIDGRRPKSKKEVRETVAAGELSKITLENTSAFSNDYDCSLADRIARLGGVGERIDFVGPDPYNKRSFYGNIFIKADGKVTVK